MNKYHSGPFSTIAILTESPTNSPETLIKKQTFCTIEKPDLTGIQLIVETSNLPTRFRHFPASCLWSFIGIGYFDRKQSFYSGRLVRVGAREILNSAKSSWPRNPSNTLNNHVCTNSVKFQIKVHSISATARIRKKLIILVEHRISA